MNVKKAFLIPILIANSAIFSSCAALGLSEPDSLTPEEAQSHEQARIEHALKQQDLVLGMRMRDVRSMWGSPVEVDTAGAPGAGNERWTYYEGLSSRIAASNARIVYFEAGQVSGWETVRR